MKQYCHHILRLISFPSLPILFLSLFLSLSLLLPSAVVGASATGLSSSGSGASVIDLASGGVASLPRSAAGASATDSSSSAAPAMNPAQETPDVIIADDFNLPGFPTRIVEVLPAVSKSSRPGSDLLHYITARTAEPFRYPYYKLAESTGSTLYISGQAKAAAFRTWLAARAEETQTDIVILPVLEGWEYRTWTGYRLFSDEMYTRAFAKITLYAYNRTTGAFTDVSASYSVFDEAMSVPSPKGVLDIVMDRVMTKLPYQRIPTDIPRYGNRYPVMPTAPVPDAAADSPYKLPAGIQQL